MRSFGDRRSSAWLFGVALVGAQSFAKVEAPHAQQTATRSSGSGLETSVVSLGRNNGRHTLTLTAKLRNGGNGILYLALGGPPPKFIDNAGGRYNLNSFSGIARCPAWDVLPPCIGLPQSGPGTLPLQSYTRLGPDETIYLAFEFYVSDDSRGPLGTFSASALYYSVPDEIRDNALSEANKKNLVRLLNLSFPPTEIAEAR